MEIIAWLIAFIVFVVIEMLTFQLLTIWFAFGSLAAMAAAMLNLSVEVQLTLFLVIAFILLATIRPAAGRYIKGHVTKTNVDSLIGMTAKVTAQINNREGFGTAVVRGQEWTAAAEDDDAVIPEGAMVTIVRISGVKLIVRREASEKEIPAKKDPVKQETL
ncbi:MAG: NfeD family protein [Lachnospiraceae bacterium]|nr:NfeD family protein [Lachnospiraceae bacterium]